MNLCHRLAIGSAAILLTLAPNGCSSAQEDSEPTETAADRVLPNECAVELAATGATASGDDGNVAKNVLDGLLATRWSSQGIGQLVTLDLGRSLPVCGVRLAWYAGDARQNDFVVATSADGIAFEKAYGGRSSGTTLAPEGVAFPPRTARYVRVTVNGNTVNDWASITELRAIGPATTDAGTPPPTPSTGASVAPVFDGKTGFVDLGNDVAFSQPNAGAITIEAWMRPDSLSMSARESSGYVHWLGKGEAGAHEWTFRMYQQGNAESRGNRTSFYAFNLSGGLGAGSYAQDTVTVGQWMHFVGVIDGTSTYLYKNGALRDVDPLSGYAIVPRHGTAPIRVATRDMNSFFKGSVSRVAIYGGKLGAARIAAHFAAREGAAYDAAVEGEPSLVSYWRLDEKSGTTAIDRKGRHDGTYRGGVKLAGATY